MPIPTIPAWGNIITKGWNNLRDIWKASKERYNNLSPEQKKEYDARVAEKANSWAADKAIPGIVLLGEMIPQTSLAMSGYAGSESWKKGNYTEAAQHMMMPAFSGVAKSGTKTALKATEKGIDAAGKAIKTADNTLTIGNALRTGKLRFGEPTTYNGIHQSNTPLTEVQFPFQRWDVITHDADPNGFWLTLAEEPNTTGTMASRPLASRWSATAQKPLIQTGEVRNLLGGKNNVRNAIVRFGRKRGADAFEFRRIKDNALHQTDVVMLTETTNPSFNSVKRLESRGNFTVYNPDYYKGRQREVAKDIITGRDDAWNYLGSDRKAITDLYNEELYNRVKSHLKTQDSFSIENFPLRRSTTPMKNPGALDSDMEWVGTNNNGFILYSGSENEAGATTRYLHHPELDEMYLSKSYDLDDTAFHEYLHRGNVGLGMNDGTKEFYNWKNRKLLKLGFENFRDKYLTNPEETAVNLIEIGRRADILDTPYQGANNTRAIIQDIIKNDPLQGSLLNQTRWETKPKRVWDALQGKYMSIIPLGIGLMNYDRNDNKTTTKGDK